MKFKEEISKRIAALNEILNKDLLFELYKSHHKPIIKNESEIKYLPQIIVTKKTGETKAYNAMMHVSNKKYADTLEEAQACLELARKDFNNKSINIKLYNEGDEIETTVFDGTKVRTRIFSISKEGVIR